MIALLNLSAFTLFAAPVPSLSDLWKLKFTESNQKQVELGESSDKALFISFFYSRCPMPKMCPLTLKKVQNLEVLLAKKNVSLQPIVITLDPAQDTPAVLSSVKKHYKLKSSWLLTASEPTISTIASIFNIFSIPSHGMISHSVKSILISKKKIIREYSDNQWEPAKVILDLKAEPETAADKPLS